MMLSCIIASNYIQQPQPGPNERALEMTGQAFPRTVEKKAEIVEPLHFTDKQSPRGITNLLKTIHLVVKLELKTKIPCWS